MAPQLLLDQVPIDLLLRSTLLLCVAWLGATALRAAAASAATRHLAWLFGIGGVLLMPALAASLPILRIAVLPPVRSAGWPEELGAAVNQTASADWTALWPLAAALYWIVAAILVLRIVTARWALARLWREAEAPDADWTELLDSGRAAFRLSRKVELRISERAAAPMTWGGLAPKLVLPAEARHWPAEQRRLIVMHELAHVVRHDALTQTAASLACAIYWIHPLIWFAARELRTAQEQASDNLVLRAGAQPRGYAQCLLQVAQAIGGRGAPMQAAAAAAPSTLERRLAALIADEDRQGPPRHVAAAIGTSALAATLLASTATPVNALGPEAYPSAHTAATVRGASPAAAPEAASHGESIRATVRRMPVEGRPEAVTGQRSRASALAADALPDEVEAARLEAETARIQSQMRVAQAEAERTLATSRQALVPRRGPGIPAGQALSPSGVPRPDEAGPGPRAPLPGPFP
jgi:beta-lactamase regulating signal transducer with metallopeptidase domain